MRCAPLLGLALTAALIAAPPADPAGPALATGVSFSPAFTPDGEALIYSFLGRGGLRAHRFADETELDFAAGLPETAQPESVFFAPTLDGRGLVFPGVAKEWAGYTCPDRDLWYRAFEEAEAIRIGECYAKPYLLDRLALQPGSSRVVFMAKGKGKQVGLFAFDTTTRETHRLDRPNHDLAEVAFYRRLSGERVVYIQDADRVEDRGVYLASTTGASEPIFLTRDLDSSLTVIENFMGRSDEPGDKDPLRVTAGEDHVVFGVKPKAEDQTSFVELWAVGIDGSAPRRLFPATTSWGTQSFVLSPDGKWAALRNFDEGMGIGVASVDGESWRFVHPPTQGWQWTNNPMLPAGSDRVFFWGDLDSQDQDTWLYIAALGEDDLRKEAVEFSRPPEHILENRISSDRGHVVIRSQVSRRKGYRLFRVDFGTGAGTMLSKDERFTDVAGFEELEDGRIFFLEAPHEKLAAAVYVWDPEGSAARRLTPDLGHKRGARSFAVDPKGKRIAYVVRKGDGPTSLHVLPTAPSPLR